MSENDDQRFTTPEFEARMVFLDEKRQPKAQPEDDGPRDPFWCIWMALDEDDPFWAELEEKIELACVNKFGEVPKKYRSPIKDGDEMEEEFFHGKRWIEMKSPKRKPGVKVYNSDGANEDVVDFDEEIYPGMVAIATARCGAYSKGQKGVGCYLNNVLKVDDGERVGPKTASADEDFEGYVKSGGSKKKSSKKKGSKKKSSKKRDPLA